MARREVDIRSRHSPRLGHSSKQDFMGPLECSRLSTNAWSVVRSGLEAVQRGGVVAFWKKTSGPNLLRQQYGYYQFVDDASTCSHVIGTFYLVKRELRPCRR